MTYVIHKSLHELPPNEVTCLDQPDDKRSQDSGNKLFGALSPFGVTLMRGEKGRHSVEVVDILQGVNCLRHEPPLVPSHLSQVEPVQCAWG